MRNQLRSLNTSMNTTLNFQPTKFITSAANIRQLPEDSGVEIAFAGRSNAGKSSALNTLTRQNALARTSKTPGRTQLINVFEVAAGKRLIDLPGYGYAKVPVAIKEKWQEALSEYLQKRQSLRGLVLLMDRSEERRVGKECKGRGVQEESISKIGRMDRN